MPSTQTLNSPHTGKLLQNRVALITGGSRGIGAAIAKLFAQHGAAVGINYHSSEDAAKEVVEVINSAGGKAMKVQADVRDQQQVVSMVAQVAEKFGAIDTLVLNANASFKIAPFMEQTWEDFDAKLTAEIKSAFYPCQAVIPSMLEQKNGCIIAISSITSRHADPSFSAHTTAKSAIDGFVKSLATELGPQGIRVNAIAPGVTLTDPVSSQPQEWLDNIAEQTPLRRNAQPEDIAGGVLLLASEPARFITGSYLMVNGGSQML
ncbi:MAG: SDR family oxidoreductase [Rivularia sp. (in: Bacteria)]|nr:SDR family oxidoreductase [Rivularia sp. MS3]